MASNELRTPLATVYELHYSALEEISLSHHSGIAIPEIKDYSKSLYSWEVDLENWDAPNQSNDFNVNQESEYCVCK